MKPGRLGAVYRQLGSLLGDGALGGLTDGQLLERFEARRDGAGERAFEALVDRHGAMVLRVCRETLRDPHDAQDAFQATFLVLARKAASIRGRDTIGPWLHGVALRVSSGARAAAARRRRHERAAAGRSARSGAQADEEIAATIHEEIGLLPERYRAPVVLCYLEGYSCEEAARQLGWPVGTVKSRLSRARDRLRARLDRRGSASSATILGAAPVAEAVPPAWAAGSVRAATSVTAGRAATVGDVPASVVALAEGAIWHMTLTKSRLATVAALGTIVVVVGLGVLAGEGSRPRDPAPPDPSTKDAPDEATRWKLAARNLRRIALAMHNYHSAHGHFPPSEIRDQDGQPLLSWRVAILPYLDPEEEMKGLYEQFRLDERWDSPHNKALLEKMPAVYRLDDAPSGERDEAPPDERRGESGHLGGPEAKSATPLRVFAGPGAVFDGVKGTPFADITDKPSKTLMVVEARTPVPWTAPDALDFRPDLPLPKLGGRFSNGAIVLFCDGSIRLLKSDAEPALVRQWITRAGGEAHEESIFTDAP